MNRELLDKPFTKGQIKQRPGAFGQMLDYVSGVITSYSIHYTKLYDRSGTAMMRVVKNLNASWKGFKEKEFLN